MDSSALLSFLSEENLNLHIGYMRTQRLRYSILEKSFPDIRGKTLSEISALRLDKDIMRDARALLCDIRLHELYFDSFSVAVPPCKLLREYYSSEAGFLYEMLTRARECTADFLCVCLRRGVPTVLVPDEMTEREICDGAVLALDIAEHAYFLDYRFETEEYLRRAISHLDLSKIEKRALDNGRRKW